MDFQLYVNLLMWYNLLLIFSDNRPYRLAEVDYHGRVVSTAALYSGVPQFHTFSNSVFTSYSTTSQYIISAIEGRFK
jgi:hypothetical protein